MRGQQRPQRYKLQVGHNAQVSTEAQENQARAHRGKRVMPACDAVTTSSVGAKEQRDVPSGFPPRGLCTQHASLQPKRALAHASWHSAACTQGAVDSEPGRCIDKLDSRGRPQHEPAARCRVGSPPPCGLGPKTKGLEQNPRCLRSWACDAYLLAQRAPLTPRTVPCSRCSAGSTAAAHRRPRCGAGWHG